MKHVAAPSGAPPGAPGRGSRPALADPVPKAIAFAHDADSVLMGSRERPPPNAAPERPEPPESSAPHRRWLGLDRLGLLQVLGGIALGLIALFSS